MRPLDEKDHQTAKLTFEKGIGDAPDDWYVVYTDPENNTMQAAAYIVTFGSGGDTSRQRLTLMLFNTKILSW